LGVIIHLRGAAREGTGLFQPSLASFDFGSGPIYSWNMSAAFITTAKYILFAVFFAGMAACGWANSRMLKRSRGAGYSYWAINPLAALAGLSIKDVLVFLAGMLVCFGAFAGLTALPK
jgi:hypothetical protein